MKILFLSHFFPPTHTAGAENYTYGIARKLVELGHGVQVLCAGKWGEGKDHWNGYTDELYNGIAVRRVHLNWTRSPDPNRYLYQNPVTAEFLRGYLREAVPDIVHITSCYSLSASVIDVVKETGLPVILTLVDFWFLCPSLHLLRSDGELCDGKTTTWECLRCMLHGAKAYRWPSQVLPQSLVRPILEYSSKHVFLNRRRGLRGMALNMEERKRYLAQQLRHVDVVISPSRFLSDIHILAVKGIAPRVQPHGHDLTWLRDDTKTRDPNVRFCYMGQISPDKGIDVLIEAFLRVQNVANVTLDIWGGLGQNPDYDDRIRSLAGLSERVRLRGRFARSQLNEVLANADVVVVPSIWYENNPLVIQEAFAAKTPVIATNLGGMSEFVQHKVNGLLFRRADIEDLACQLRRVATEPGLLERLREGIPPVKRVEEEIEELLAIYEQLTCRRKTAAS